MATEINPLDVAFVEKDMDLGGYFVYMEEDLRDRATEPVGHIVNAKVYTKLVSVYGIPTVDEHRNGKRKNASKIREMIGKFAPPPPIYTPEPEPVDSDVDDVLSTKMCPCGNTMSRSDYPKLSDSNWNSKKYCSKQCARRFR